MKKLYIQLLSLFFIVFNAPQNSLSWGSVGHKFINKNSVVHLPASMMQFIQQDTLFGNHASDADKRKSSDTSESPKHFLDIDWYPNYHSLTHNLDSLLNQYGWQTVVNDNGILPWATVWALDSLTNQLQRGDWNKAYLTASDLGHYVGDAHQPLHNANNYDGYQTGNNGIHSRYETTMIGKFQAQLIVFPVSVHYIEHPLDFAFQYTYHSNSLIDSIFHADDSAKAISGWNGSGSAPQSYYDALWAKTELMTLDQMQSATYDLACLFYTAWVNAGLIPLTVHEANNSIPFEFTFSQNYPNPFNPITTLSFVLAQPTAVSLRIYNVLGQEIATLINNKVMEAGEHRVQFDAGSFPSSVYFARLQTEHKTAFRKLVLLK